MRAVLFVWAALALPTFAVFWACCVIGARADEREVRHEG